MPFLIKQIIFNVLLSIPDSIGKYMEWLAYYARFGKWTSEYINTFPNIKTYESRFALYDYLLAEQFDRDILYLEFGVFKGESIRYFIDNHLNQESAFFGFDTFTGLPEDWQANIIADVKAETFDVQGNLPQVRDSRVKFYKGLFIDTVPNFKLEQKMLLESNKKIVIHIDADLYSSTLYVLSELQEYIFTGTIIIFDEFRSVVNEFRALEDFCKSHERKYKVKGITTLCTQVAIQIL
jgi:O-methyltransferase